MPIAAVTKAAIAARPTAFELCVELFEVIICLSPENINVWLGSRVVTDTAAATMNERGRSVVEVSAQKQAPDGKNPTACMPRD
jgi:hypothetical protein